MAEKKCILRPIDVGLEVVTLNDNTPVTLGRGPLTKIRDSRCSRTQVVLVADYAKNVVKATQLGRNACGVNGQEMKKDKPLELKDGDKLDILMNQYSYNIEFCPYSEKNAIEKPVNEVSDSDDEVLVPPSKVPRVEQSVGVFCPERWEKIDGVNLVIYKPPGVTNKPKIAAYDLDSTIISSKSGSAFPKNDNDWRIMHMEILTKMKQIENEGFKIVIFTNQASLSSRTNIAGFQSRIEGIVAKLKVPAEVYISGGKGKYRKPMTGMWDAMVERNGGVAVDMRASFYCGDAAGREQMQGRKADFSQADILFAKNLGLTFFTPEEHFLGKKNLAQSRLTAFSFHDIPIDLPLCDPEDRQILSQRPELVLMVGSPGSGKSHFSKTHLVPGGYIRISRDEKGNMARCLQQVESQLQRGAHVVVDNTNPTASARAKFIEIAKKHKIPVRAFVMNTSKSHARHNNKFRELTDKSHAPIQDFIIHSFHKNFEEPNISEGFSEIVKINFWPVFSNPEHEKLYKMFLTDK